MKDYDKYLKYLVDGGGEDYATWYNLVNNIQPVEKVVDKNELNLLDLAQIYLLSDGIVPSITILDCDNFNKIINALTRRLYPYENGVVTPDDFILVNVDSEFYKMFKRNIEDRKVSEEYIRTLYPCDWTTLRTIQGEGVGKTIGFISYVCRNTLLDTIQLFEHNKFFTINQDELNLLKESGVNLKNLLHNQNEPVYNEQQIQEISKIFN